MTSTVAICAPRCHPAINANATPNSTATAMSDAGLDTAIEQ
jgi:hypothetical protein